MSMSGLGIRKVRNLWQGKYESLTVRDLVLAAHALGMAPADLVPGFKQKIARSSDAPASYRATAARLRAATRKLNRGPRDARGFVLPAAELDSSTETP